MSQVRASEGLNQPAVFQTSASLEESNFHSIILSSIATMQYLKYLFLCLPQNWCKFTVSASLVVYCFIWLLTKLPSWNLFSVQLLKSASSRIFLILLLIHGVHSLFQLDSMTPYAYSRSVSKFVYTQPNKHPWCSGIMPYVLYVFMYVCMYVWRLLVNVVFTQKFH